MFVTVLCAAAIGFLNSRGVLPDWFDGDAGADSTTDVVGFANGCEPFQVIAQNRWTPVGAAVRAAPSATSRKVDSVPPNLPISIDGWVTGNVAYPHNSPPFDSNIWFHLTDDSGWVSFAGVRAVPTYPDETLSSDDGGEPAIASKACHGAIAG